MSRLGPAFDAAQRAWDMASEDDAYSADETEEEIVHDYDEEMYERP